MIPAGEDAEFRGEEWPIADLTDRRANRTAATRQKER